MSYALDNLSASERETIARSCFEVAEKRGDELHGLCPYHGEKNTSFSYNITKDVCNCFSCGAAGDLISLWGHTHGYTDNKEAFSEFKRQHGNDYAPTPRHRQTPTPGGSFANGGQGEDENTRTIPDSEYTKLPQLDGILLQHAKSYGWSDAIIKKYDLRQKNGRITIPVRRDDGQLLNVRMYQPGASDNKIISWGAGYGKNKLFPAPSSWKKRGPILLCEGEKDTLTALSKGFNATTQTAGANSWADQFTRFFTQRDVVIAYDADEKGANGATKVAKKLSQVAKSIKIITWPAQTMPMQEDHGQDLTDYFTHGYTAQDLKDLIANTKAQIVQKPAPENQNTDVQRFFGGERGKTFRPRLVADEILQWRQLITDPCSGITYTWDETQWTEYDQSNIRRQILNMLDLEGTTPRVNDALSIVRDLSNIDEGREMNDIENKIPIKSGIFDIETGQIHEHDPKNYNNYIIDVEIDLNGPLPECKMWQDFLHQTINDAATIRELQKFFGYCLTRETRFEKALLLIGPGGDGKGTILEMLQHLVGKVNTSNVTLGEFQDQFHRVMLMDKLLNVATEVEAGLLQSDIFKTIVSGENITAAYKHRNAFSFRPVCKLAFSANKHPRLQDTSDGLYRRLLIIEMENQFVKKGIADKYLEDKMIKELSGIFLWALRGLQILREEDFTPSEKMQTYLEEYQEMNDPLLSFCNTYIEDAPVAENAHVPTEDVYKAYRRFCDAGNYRALSDRQFGKDFKKYCANLVRKKRTVPKSQKRAWCYHNIRLLED